MDNIERVRTWGEAKKLDDETIAEVIRHGFNSMEALALVAEDDVDEFKIPRGQKKLLLRAVKKTFLQDDTPVPRAANESNMADDEAEVTDIDGPEVLRPGGAPVTGNENGDPYVREIISQLKQHQSGGKQGHLQGQTSSGNGLNSLSLTGINDIVTWQDPQLCFKSVDNNLSSKHLDIVDFVSSNVGGINVGQENLLSDASGGQLIYKSGPAKPKLESISLSDWSVANLSIMYKLLESGDLASTSQHDYLSYTKRIYQLVKFYEITSVFFYDREYRCLQHQHRFRWGTDVPHLQTVFLRPKGQQAKSHPQRTVSSNHPIGKQFTYASHASSGKQICKKFNSRQGCHMQNCRFEHVCGVPGFVQSHTAQNHQKTECKAFA